MRKQHAPALIVSVARRGRAGLLRTTALQAAAIIVLSVPAIAQPLPNARPAGGVVVGGAASIAQTQAQTTVQQASQRAAIDWRSFDIGSGHTVQYNQPNASAIVLNRVTGPDPSQIAGRIQANGQVIITNQSGVVFHQGAQVDTAGLIVSAAGIAPSNFMAGRMVFDQAPKPDAAVTNAGTITVREAGLAALVAPRVANSGVINARMGRAVLAGAETHTVDLYGDGLLAIDVTSQVRQAPRGPDGKPVTALVTNTGTVTADGGSVQITAAAADGIVQNLVQAGGTIRANAAGGRAGSVVIAGVGGSLRIEGNVTAAGGGTITATATDTVTVAAPARVAASSGTVNIGSRSTGGVTVEAGARISANARAGAPGGAPGTGDGGKVAIISNGTTRMDGRVAARGGRAGGNGGQVEVSGKNVGLTGVIDTGAPKGRIGSVLIDPTDVTISDHGGPGTVITPASLQATVGNVTVQADNSIVASSSVTLTGTNQALTLNAGNFIRVDAGVTLDVTGTMTLQAGAGGVSLLGNVTPRAPKGLIFNTTGAVTQGPGSIITAAAVQGTVGSAALTSAVNQISTVGFDGGPGTPSVPTFTATTGDIAVSSAVPVTIQGAYFSAGTVVPNGRSITVASDRITVANDGGLAASAPGGVIALQPLTSSLPIEVTNGAPTVGTLSLSAPKLALLQTPTLALGTAAGAGITLAADGTTVNFGTLGFTTLRLRSRGNVGQVGTVAIPNVDATGFNIDLSGPGNTIPAITQLAAPNDALLHTGGVLTVNGLVTGFEKVVLSSAGNVSPSMILNGDIRGGTISLDTFNGTSLFSSGAIQQNSGTINAAFLTGRAQSATFNQPNAVTLAGFTTSGDFAYTGQGSVFINGAIAVGGTATLTTTGQISEGTNGSLTASALTGSAASVSLPSTSNTISSFGNFTTSTGGFAATTNLSDGTPTVINGLISVPNGQTIALTTDRLSIRAGGLSAPGGSVVLAPLTDGRPLELVGAGSTQSTTALSLSQADLGFITTGTLTFGSPTAGPITLGQVSDSITVTGHASTLNLLSHGAVSQGAAASLTVPTLTGNVDSVVLGGANAVGTLGAFTTAGPLNLNNTVSLAVAGPVNAGGALSLTTGGAAGVTFTGTVNAPSVTVGAGTGGIVQSAGTIATAGTINLTTTGAVTQSGTGAITAATLTGSSTGATTLTSTTNSIAALGPYAATGDLSFSTLDPLAITGAVSGNSVTLNAPGLSFTTSGITATNTATLNIAGAITDTGQAVDVTAATLSGSAVSGNFGGNVQTLSNFTTTGALTFADTGALTVTGTVGGGTSLGLTAFGLTLSGTLSANAVSLTSNITTAVPGSGAILQSGGSVTGTGSVVVAAAGAFTQTGGTIATASLSGSAGGATSLTSSNAIAQLGPYTSGGAFTLNDGTTALSLVGALNAGANAVSLTAASITETGAGAITAGRLTGSTTGAATFGNVNAIPILAGFVSGGAFTLNDGGTALTLTAPLNAGANTVALTAGSLSQRAAGVVTAGSLSGAIAGTANLGTATNAVSGLGTLSTGAFTLNDGGTALGITGAVNAGANTVTLTAGSLTETGTGAITAGSLTGSTAAGVSLRGPNAIGTLAGFTAGGNFSLNDGATALTLTGPLNVGVNTVTLDAGSLAQTAGGVITAATLSGSTVGTANLGTAVNAIGNLGAFVSGGAFTLNDGATALTLTGTLNAGANAVTLNAGSLNEAGGAITAGSLSGTTSGAALLTGGNAISTIAAFNSGGAFTLNDAGTALSINGALNAGGNTVTLTAASLVQTAAGVITAGTLTGATTGAANLGTATNAIGALGAFTAGGAFTLNDGATALSITGLVNAGPNTVTLTAASLTATGAGAIVAGALSGATTGAVSLTGADAIAGIAGFTSGGAFTLNDGATALVLTGTLNAGANTVTINAGSLNETGVGTITAGALTGSTAGATNLGNVNTIATLAGFISGGAFTLNDGSTGLSVTGALNAGANTVTLTAATLSQTAAGVITAGSLAGAIAGTANLGTATNAIAGLGTLSTGAFTLNDGGTALTITGAVNAGGNAVAINAGSLAESGAGAITAATLTGSTTGPALLNGANQIATLAGFSSAGGFALTDARALTVSGAVTDTTSISLAAAGALTLGANVSAPALTLASTAALTQTAGTITATTLAVSDGSAALTQAANSVATLAGVLSTGDFALTDARTLNVTGTVTSGTTIRLAVTGDLTLSGALAAPTLTLNASGNITQPSGAVTATTLSGTAGGSFLLGSSTNQVTNLGPVTATAAVGLTDARSLTITGAIDPPDVTLNVAGDLAINSSIIAGTLALNVTGAVTEAATGSISAVNLRGVSGSVVLGTAVRVGTLADFTTVGVLTVLDSAALTVAGPVNAGDTFTARSTGTMTVAGSIASPTVNLSATAMPITAGLNNPGDIVFAAGTLNAFGSGTTLNAAGAISQTGGILTSTTLNGSAGSAVALGSASNRVAAVGPFSSTGGFNLASAIGLAVTAGSTISDTTSISLQSGGAMPISGRLQTPKLTLTAAGAITEGAAGTIAATSLTGSAAGASFNNPGNTLTNLDSFASTGAFLLNTPSNLNVTGPVSAVGQLTLTPGTLALQPGGSLSAPGGIVALAPFQPGAAFTLSNFLPVSTTSAVTASTLQVGNANSGDITVASAFNLPSVGTLALVSGGAIAQGAGANITVPRLTASGTSVRLDQANVVGTLGDSTATNGFTFNTVGTLTVAGTVNAGSGITLSADNVTLGSTGTTGLAGTLRTPGQVNLNASNAISELNGAVVAGSLTGSAASADFRGANQTPVLAGFTITGLRGGFTLNDAGPLTLTAPLTGNANASSISLNTTGLLTLQAGINAPAVNLAASSIGQTAGTNNIGTLNVLTTAGDATLLGSIGLLGTAQVPGTLRIVNPATRSLQVFGPVTVGTLDLTGGDVGFTGTATAGTLRLNAGNVTQGSGSLTVGTLTGTTTGVLVLGPTSLGTGTAAIGTITNTSAGPLLQVVSTGQMTLTGINQANAILVRAPGITLAGGSLVGDGITLDAAATGATLPGRVTPLAAGLPSVTQPGITQTGTTAIGPRTAATSALTLQVHGGDIALNNLAAPKAATTLALEAGTAAGTLNVNSLFVNGQAGNATLFGTVGGNTGFAAAQVSSITKFDTAYILNGCAIASASCVPLTTTLPPIAPPPITSSTEPVVRIVFPSTIRPTIGVLATVLRPDLFTVDLITLDIVRNPSDPDFALPNISDRDY